MKRPLRKILAVCALVAASTLLAFELWQIITGGGVEAWFWALVALLGLALSLAELTSHEQSRR